MADDEKFPTREEVNAAADRRIRERGLKDFKEEIDKMAEDPSYAPEPLDLLEAGIPEEGDDAPSSGDL